ncbi:MAG: hypothetical protein ACKV19_02750 [Verrucomicrobiales bacterium]
MKTPEIGERQLRSFQPPVNPVLRLFPRIDNVGVSANVIPEPSAALLTLLPLAGLRRRRR